MKNKQHRKFRQRIGLLFPILIVFTLFIGTYSTFANESLFRNYQLGSELSSSAGIISARENGIELTKAGNTWSAERMQQAQPYPLPAAYSVPDVTKNLNEPVGEPIYFPSALPLTGQPGELIAEETAVQSSLSTTGYDYPPPYTRYENFDSYQVFPYSTIGVLFFSQRGSDYRCSAAVVGEHAVWTAGHCVHDGSGEPEGWSENVVFIPAYKDGDEPYGSWSYFDLVTRTAWFSSGDLRYDIGGVIMNPNGSGKSIKDVVGRLGFAANLDPVQHWFNFGYPSNAPFDGKTMQICAGSFARYAIGVTAPIPVGMGCDMTKGSSGGPWITNFSGSIGDSNFLNGNNSFRYIVNGDEEIYSPYFGDEALDLLFYIATEDEVLLPIIHSTGDQ